MGNDFKIARIAHFAILREIHELNSIGLDTAFPNLVLEAPGATVKMVGTVVDRKLVLHSINAESALGNTVGKTTWTLA